MSKNNINHYKVDKYIVYYLESIVIEIEEFNIYVFLLTLGGIFIFLNQNMIYKSSKMSLFYVEFIYWMHIVYKHFIINDLYRSNKKKTLKYLSNSIQITHTQAAPLQMYNYVHLQHLVRTTRSF